MLPRGRRRGRGLLAPPVELPAEYLKKYPHSNRGVLCSQGRKKGDYHQSKDGRCELTMEDGSRAVVLGERLEITQDIVDALRLVASEGELCSHCDGVAPWREPLARPQRIVAGLP